MVQTRFSSDLHLEGYWLYYYLEIEMHNEIYLYFESEGVGHPHHADLHPIGLLLLKLQARPAAPHSNKDLARIS